MDKSWCFVGLVALSELEARRSDARRLFRSMGTNRNTFRVRYQARIQTLPSTILGKDREAMQMNVRKGILVPSI